MEFGDGLEKITDCIKWGFLIHLKRQVNIEAIINFALTF